MFAKNVYVSTYLKSSYHSSPIGSYFPPGLPDGLPDAVCPAAVLQYVLRPPQQRRETNITVDRPLAPPSAARHLLPSTTPPQNPLLLHHHLCSHDEFNSIAKRKETWVWDDGPDRGRGWDGKSQMHLPIIPLFLRTCDGMKDFADVEMRRMKRWETAQVCSWRGVRSVLEVGVSPRPPLTYWSDFRLGREDWTKRSRLHGGTGEWWYMNGLFCHVLFVT